LFELNPGIDFVVLSFNFEMMSSKQIGRKLSYKLKKTTQELYSGKQNEQLSDKDFELVLKEAERIKKYPIYYVDMPKTVEDIYKIVLEFSRNEGKDK
jgi:replicative DNA helicase